MLWLDIVSVEECKIITSAIANIENIIVLNVKLKALINILAAEIKQIIPRKVSPARISSLHPKASLIALFCIMARSFRF